MMVWDGFGSGYHHHDCLMFIFIMYISFQPIPSHYDRLVGLPVSTYTWPFFLFCWLLLMFNLTTMAGKFVRLFLLIIVAFCVRKPAYYFLKKIYKIKPVCLGVCEQLYERIIKIIWLIKNKVIGLLMNNQMEVLTWQLSGGYASRPILQKCSYFHNINDDKFFISITNMDHNSNTVAVKNNNLLNIKKCIQYFDSTWDKVHFR